MTLADYSLTAFTVLNGARLVAYLPQIVCLARDRAGATSVSMMTWGMFFSANVATVFYALTAIRDNLIASVFAANALACIAIFALIVRKRVVHSWGRNRRLDDGHVPPADASLRTMMTGYFERLSDRLEDRIAARHLGDRWTDSVERQIIQDWQNHRGGRLH